MDVAVLLGEEHAGLSLKEELRLRSRVTEALRRDDVDLVILNHAPPVLRYEVISAGCRLIPRRSGWFRGATAKEESARLAAGTIEAPANQAAGAGGFAAAQQQQR